MVQIKIILAKLHLAKDAEHYVYDLLSTLGFEFYNTTTSINESCIITLREDLSDTQITIIKLYLKDLSEKFSVGPIALEVN